MLREWIWLSFVLQTQAFLVEFMVSRKIQLPYNSTFCVYRILSLGPSLFKEARATAAQLLATHTLIRQRKKCIEGDMYSKHAQNWTKFVDLTETKDVKNFLKPQHISIIASPNGQRARKQCSRTTWRNLSILFESFHKIHSVLYY